MFKCKRCKKNSAERRGVQKNKSGWISRYFCKSCGKWFVDREGFERHRINSDIISLALDLRAKGMSLADVVDHLDQHHKTKVTRQTIANWQSKFGKKLNSFTQNLVPILGEVYHADEMFVKVNGEWNYNWSCLDYLTKFLVTQHFSHERNDKEAVVFIGKVKSRTSKPPNEIHTDNSWDYHPAFRKYFPRNRKIHKHFPAWKMKFKNNPIERYFNTLKQRYKTMRGFDNTKSAENFFEFFGVYYNFIRKHTSIGKITPAQAANINLNLSRNRIKSMIKIKLIFLNFEFCN